MITLKNKKNQKIHLYSNQEQVLQQGSFPVLHIVYEDGFTRDEQLKALNNILDVESEWYLSYGPDSLLWSQCAEIKMISHISEDPLLHGSFQSIHFDDNSPLTKAFHKLFDLGSAKNDNKSYETFIVISDNLTETTENLIKMGFIDEN